jgi:low affinity Fe/Cu permease
MPAPISFVLRTRRCERRPSGAAAERPRAAAAATQGEGLHMTHIFDGIAKHIAGFAGRPAAFAVAFMIVLVWAVTGPIFNWSDTWQLVINTGTTIVTFLMVFLIQNAQNRDGSAIQCKLDELIRAVGHARNQFIGIEHLSEADLLKLQKKLEEIPGGEVEHRAAIARLIERR